MLNKLIKVTLLHGCFHVFLNRANRTKFCTSHIYCFNCVNLPAVNLFSPFFCKITKRKHVGNIPWKSISFPNFVIINFINQYLFKCICERCLTETEWELRKLRVCCLLNFKSKSVTLNVISQKKFYANNAIDNFVVFAVFTIRKRLIYL